MKNKPISKSFKVKIILKYDNDSLEDGEYEVGDHPTDELDRMGWFVIHDGNVWTLERGITLYEGEEKIIRHPDGEEYTYKVCKKE